MTYSTVPLNSAHGLDRPVQKLMHHGYVTIPAGLPLAVAARTMAARHVHAVLVCDVDGAALGWVTTRGMLHNLPRDWDCATAGEGISESVVSVPPTASVRDALQAFLASGASHILVRDRGDSPLLGVLAESDLLAALAT